MPLCFYGCNKESKYQLKNGKFCCESNPAKCEIIFVVVDTSDKFV